MAAATSTATSTAIIDDKSEICIPFILNQLKLHRNHSSNGVFFIGLNGLQGVGKTTLVNLLEQTLLRPPYSLNVVVLSIDDLYLTHADQLALAALDPSNKLVQHRGEPGTHDMHLAAKVFDDLANGKHTWVPSYDKSLFAGKGDRKQREEWKEVNKEGEPKVDVVLFEGWCVGFTALEDEQVEAKWKASVKAHESSLTEAPTTTLWQHSLDHLLFVNNKLREYATITDRFNAMIHIDALDTNYVYKWRLQQEAEMRAAKGTGMSDDQVIHFVDGYYPAYELYTDKLRQGVLSGRERQLRLVVNENRKVVKSIVI